MSASNSTEEKPTKERKPGNRFKIEDFDLIRLLGEGRVGKVYYAIERRKKFGVAIKVINKKVMEELQLNNEVFNEMYIHSGLEHANILKFLTYFHNEESIYLVLEHAKFGSIFSIRQDLKYRRFDEICAAQYTYQIACGLLYLHGRGFLHGDLKTENVLIDSRNNVKIADFGFSYFYTASYTHRSFCGTYEYMAPEILTKDFYDFSIDIWSLGVLVYEMLVGRGPFDHRRKDTLISRIINMQYEFTKHVSEDAQNLISKLLVKREERLSLHEVLNHEWIKRCCPDPSISQEAGSPKNVSQHCK